MITSEYVSEAEVKDMCTNVLRWGGGGGTRRQKLVRAELWKFSFFPFRRAEFFRSSEANGENLFASSLTDEESFGGTWVSKLHRPVWATDQGYVE